MKKGINYNRISFVVILISAFILLAFTLHAGQNNKSFLLVLMFMAWMLSPFIALLFVNFIFKGLALTFYLSIAISLCSLICYSGKLNIVGDKPAFKFLIVPLISWVVIIIAFIRLGILSKK